MLKPLYFLATFAEAGLSVFGIRPYEQPAYAVTRKLGDDAELRSYKPAIAVETVIADGGDGEAFGRLFRYITGANLGGSTVTVTASVRSQGTLPEAAPPKSVSAKDGSAKDGRLLAMTVPVELAGDAGDRRMRFFLPQEAQADPPAPTDPKVRIVALPAATFAALRFSGSLSTASRARAAARLHAILARAGIAEDGPPSTLSYDPPFTIPFLRRNEIAVRVAVR